eukprot:1407689-Pleurochrysis_carterae.AAC.1
MSAAFSNRRQNRFKGALEFHPDEMPEDLLKLLKDIDIEVKSSAPRLLDDAHTGATYLANQEARDAPQPNNTPAVEVAATSSPAVEVAATSSPTVEVAATSAGP